MILEWNGIFIGVNDFGLKEKSENENWDGIKSGKHIGLPRKIVVQSTKIILAKLIYLIRREITNGIS